MRQDCAHGALTPVQGCQWEGQDVGTQRRDFSDSLHCAAACVALVKFLRLSELLFLIYEWARGQGLHIFKL